MNRLKFIPALIKIGRCPNPRDFEESSASLLKWIHLAFEKSGQAGASSGYHLSEGWGKPYPEITGYLIPTLLDYQEIELAKKAGAWLASVRFENGSVCRKEWEPSNKVPSVFNTAQVIKGWCALYAQTGNPMWLNEAKKSADWLLSLQNDDGVWTEHTFNSAPRTYYAYAASALALLWKLSGKAEYAHSSKKKLNWVLSQQDKDGWFKKAGFNDAELPSTHTAGYVLEGLLDAGEILNENRYLFNSEIAAFRLLDVYNKKGFLPGVMAAGWTSKSKSRCLTGDAQMGLVWAKLALKTGDRRFLQGATQIANDLRKTQRILPDWPQVSGAIQGSEPHWGDYDAFRYPTHASKFMLDLLFKLKALEKKN